MLKWACIHLALLVPSHVLLVCGPYGHGVQSWQHGTWVSHQELCKAWLWNHTPQSLRCFSLYIKAKFYEKISLVHYLLFRKDWSLALECWWHWVCWHWLWNTGVWRRRKSWIRQRSSPDCLEWGKEHQASEPSHQVSIRTDSILTYMQLAEQLSLGKNKFPIRFCSNSFMTYSCSYMYVW